MNGKASRVRSYKERKKEKRERASERGRGRERQIKVPFPICNSQNMSISDEFLGSLGREKSERFNDLKKTI